MLLSHVIHFLEVVTALLFVALAVQLYRCYQQFENAKRSSTKQSSESIQVSTEDISDSEIIQVRDNAQPVVSKKVASKASVASGKGSDAILTDYIGGFFGAEETASPDISEFKAPAPERVVEMRATTESLLADLEEMDDTIITVVEEQTSDKESSVMSERVVHAMLDEAKLVCNS